MPKGLFIFIHLFMLLLSFSTTCLGVLCMSINSSMCRCGKNKLVFYCLLALGLCLLVTGIFWSTFHEVLKYRALGIFIQNPSHREPHVFTIDRYVLQMNWEGGMLLFKHTMERSNTRFLQNANPVAILLFFCGENCSLKFYLLEQATMSKQPFMQTIPKVRKAKYVLGCIQRSVTNSLREGILLFGCVFMSPHLENLIQIWRPWHRKGMDLLQWVQKSTMKMIRGMEHFSCDDRLRDLELFSPREGSIWFSYFRPDFYPPSYENSIDPEKLVCPLSFASKPKKQEFINIPLPPYSESSARFVSETNEQEQPPPYT
ncbi:transmembrane protein 252 [Anomalospiza imberbis]|uniref:transmembrane protein 252 n=1 Tax=Anomalospiza imberbis TaxID=187417 RepID=UPI00358EE224